MKYSRALAGLLTVALSSPVLADQCSDACTAQHDACVAAPQANHASCAADYAGCLGYNPYAGDTFVAPTACSKSTVMPTGTPAPVTTTAPAPTPTDACEETCQNNYTACISGAGSVTSVCDGALNTCKSKCGVTPPTPDSCLADCNKKHDNCNSAPNANHATCAAEYSECLGYNPYGGNGFVEPTACSKAPMSTMSMMPKPTMTVSPEACCAACTKVYQTCCAAPEAVMDTCHAEYTSCLGYNPFEVTPYVEPTACVVVVNNPKPTSTTGQPIIVNAGGRIQPALALIALGAIALVCEYFIIGSGIDRKLIVRMTRVHVATVSPH